MLNNEEIINLLNKSYKNRMTLLNIIKKCGAAHIGGASSAMDILTVLYNKILKHKHSNPKWEERDIFILSAGHKAIALYIVLQSEGYFKKNTLWTYNKLNTMISMHPSTKLPGIEFPTGSLGHGLSVASGIAHAFKMDGSKRKVYVLMGDGESAEGAVWEAALGAAKYKLDNLIAVIDVNKIQSENYTNDILPLEPFEQKYLSFGWSVRSIDGHNISQIYKGLYEAPYEIGKPTIIIANTIKGKGIDYAEANIDYHYWGPESDNEINKAIKSIKLCYKREVNKVGKDC